MARVCVMDGAGNTCRVGHAFTCGSRRVTSRRLLASHGGNCRVESSHTATSRITWRKLSSRVESSHITWRNLCRVESSRVTRRLLASHGGNCRVESSRVTSHGDFAHHGGTVSSRVESHGDFLQHGGTSVEPSYITGRPPPSSHQGRRHMRLLHVPRGGTCSRVVPLHLTGAAVKNMIDTVEPSANPNVAKKERSSSSIIKGVTLDLRITV
jgi:hypothetical protein